MCIRDSAQLLQQTLDAHPDPDVIWADLKTLDRKLAAIEGDTFDGVYMVYQDRYLYSWDTPYSQYESTGYRPQDRPWYQDAVQGQGAIVFTPPYMSYANHYILSTISQLQPDQETVFAYDIKMGNIQQLVRELGSYDPVSYTHLSDISAAPVSEAARWRDWRFG